jgi:hypothetical protein
VQHLLRDHVVQATTLTCRNSPTDRHAGLVPWRTLRTGNAMGLRNLPSHDYKINQAWLDATMIACILLSWLKLLALDGDLAKAEPKTCATASCTPPPAWSGAGAADA